MATMYTCEGCSATYTGTAEDAFKLGWDTPERFMSHTTCPTCPISSTLWWRVVVQKQTELTHAEAALLQEYRRMFEAAQGEVDLPEGHVVQTQVVVKNGDE